MNKLLILLSTLFLFAHLNAADITIKVQTKTENQVMVGFGGALCYYDGWLTAHSQKSTIYNYIFNELEPAVIRIANWAQDMTIDNSQVEIINQANSRLKDGYTLLMSSWSAPAELKANSSTSGSSSGNEKGTLKKIDGKYVYDEYAAWWKNSLKLYHSKGIYPDYISMQNEPDLDADYEGTLLYPKETAEVAGYPEALEALYLSLQDMENRPNILGPEPLGIGYEQVLKYCRELNTTYLDAYCYHLYHGGENSVSDRYSNPDNFTTAMRAMVEELDAKDPKPYFMTENCAMRTETPDDAVNLAHFIANSVLYNKATSYLHWSLVWAGENSCITIQNPWTSNQYSVNADFYALKHFTKHVKKGWIHIGSSNRPIRTAAFKSADGSKVSIIMINTSATDSHSIKLSLDNDFDIYNGKTVQTIPAEKIWWNESDYLVDQPVVLPKRSITTITFEMQPSGLQLLENEMFTTRSKQFIHENGELICVADKEGEFELEIFDVAGRLQQSKTIALQQGVNNIATNLPKGLYLISLNIIR